MNEVILTPDDMRLLLEVVNDNKDKYPALDDLYEKLLDIVELVYEED
jgi:hypothetical protein